jgi:glucose-1-phosphate cytidylyltransferase
MQGTGKMTKTVILAGGKGTRLTEETSIRPKPMVEIGGKPILWHIMQLYGAHGFTDFLIACGYKGEAIKEYFHDFSLHSSDYFIDMATGERTVVNGRRIGWKVGLIDTGQETQTGGRIRRLREWIGEEPFMVTYGDGLGDINICALLDFHRSHGKIATVTAVRPPARFGNLTLRGNAVCEFAEKPQTDEGWINGGFFVFDSAVFDYLEDDSTGLEKEVLEQLARKNELMAFHHPGFWQPMDTLREKLLLEALWSSGQAPWKIWK